MYPQSLRQLIEVFKLLPGVGEKTAERYALEVLNWAKDDINLFANSLISVSNNIHKCQICGNYTENDICDICKDSKRNKNIICVVQEAKDIIAIEKTNEYQGVYHVLNGVISTTKGILPSDINISSLLTRINEETEEVIIATNPTIDGETTAMYLAKLLSNKNVVVTRLASGLPMGGHLDYTDELTLLKAIENRQKL